MKRLLTVAFFLLATAGVAFAQDAAPLQAHKSSAVPFTWHSNNNVNKTSAANAITITYWRSEAGGQLETPDIYSLTTATDTLDGFFNTNRPVAGSPNTPYGSVGTVFARFINAADSVISTRATNYRVDSVVFDLVLLKQTPNTILDTLIFQLVRLDSFRLGAQTLSFPSRNKAPLMSDTVVYFNPTANAQGQLTSPAGIINYVLKTSQICSFTGEEVVGAHITNGQPVAAIIKMLGPSPDLAATYHVVRGAPGGGILYNQHLYSVAQRGEQLAQTNYWSSYGTRASAGANLWFWDFAQNAITAHVVNDTAFICVDTSSTGINMGNTVSFDNAYPNPAAAGSIITLPFNLKVAGTVSAQVTNLNGQVVFTHESKHLSAGQYDFTLNTANYTAGIYFFSIKTETGLATQKIVIY